MNIYTVTIEHINDDGSTFDVMRDTSFEWIAKEVAQAYGMDFHAVMNQINNSRVTMSGQQFAVVQVA